MNIKVNKYIEKIKPYKGGKPIEELQRELGMSNVIKLASNENAFGPSPLVTEALKKALVNVNRYPDGSCFYLKRDLSQFLNVKSENIILGNGSDEIILLALRAFVKPREEVIFSHPSFLMYKIYAQSCNVKPVKASLKDYEYDLEAIEKVVTPKTKIIFFATPNNPTGTYINKTKLERFLEKLRDDILVYLDEAYFEYVEASDFPNSLDLLKRFKNLVVVRTFSKAYGLAGLRIGYSLADSSLIGIMNRIRDPFNVNYLAQVAACAALKDKVFLKQVKKLTVEGKNYFYKELDLLNLDFIRSEANFVLIDFGKKAGNIADKLLIQGVIVRAMKDWGLENCIRVTVGEAKENVKFISALKKIIK